MTSLRQLECLVKVVEAGSFTRAAMLMHVTQPALSHQIRTLEHAVGGALLDRLPRSAQLTAAGRALLPHARAALEHAGRAMSAARQAVGVESRELRVSSVCSITTDLLPSTLRTWHRSHADVRVRVVEHRHTDELRTSMDTEQIDVGIGPSPSNWDGQVHRLGSEEFVVVVPADDPLAANETRRVDLSALASRPWVHYSSEKDLAMVVDLACAAAGFRPVVAMRAEEPLVAAQIAAAGLGVALVTANVIPPWFGGIVLRPEPPVQRELYAYTRGETDPLAAEFVDTLVHEAQVTLVHEARVAPAHVHRKRELDGDHTVFN